MFKFDVKPRTTYKNGSFRIKTISSDPIQLEKEYMVKKEKKMQKEILSKTIKKFRENSKISPFDIKIKSKYRIKTKLNFFLMDRNIEHKNLLEKSCQVSKFLKMKTLLKNGKKNKNLKKFRKENFFQMKKTGKDQGAQVETEFIFNLEKSLLPIVKNLKTKILEQSLLEVKQEIELKNLKKIKQKYFYEQKNIFQKKKNYLFLKEKKNLMDKKKIYENEKEKNKLKNEKDKKQFFLDLSKNTISNIFDNIKKEIKNINYLKNKIKNEKRKKIIFYGDLKNWLIEKTNKKVINSQKFNLEFEKIKIKNQRKKKSEKKIKLETKTKTKTEKKIKNYYFQILDLKKNRNNLYNFYSVFEKEIFSENLNDAKNFFFDNYQEDLDLTDTNKKNPIINISLFKKISFRFSHNLFEKISSKISKIKPFIILTNFEGDVKIFDLYEIEKNNFIFLKKNQFSFQNLENWEIEGDIFLDRNFDIKNISIFLKIGKLEDYENIIEKFFDFKYELILNNEIIKKYNLTKKILFDKFSKNIKKDEIEENEDNEDNKENKNQSLLIKLDIINFFDDKIFLDFQNNYDFFYSDFQKFVNLINENIYKYSFPVESKYLVDNWHNEEFYENSIIRNIHNFTFSEFNTNLFNFENIKNLKDFIIEKISINELEKKSSEEILEESFENEKNIKEDNFLKIPYLAFFYNRKLYLEDQSPELIKKFLEKKIKDKNFYKIKIGVYFLSEKESLDVQNIEKE